MSRLVFASNNPHKLEEMQRGIGGSIEIISLTQAGIDQDIPEPFDTLEENALAKAQTIFRLTNLDCFSEDTGLEVPALNGAPGVRSARYAGENRSAKDNIDKLLHELGQSENRRARFRTVISLIWKDATYFFEGTCEGAITRVPRGVEGFGYDPVFQPDGSEKTFAEMSIEEKNLFSHRKKAADKLVLFLQTGIHSIAHL